MIYLIAFLLFIIAISTEIGQAAFGLVLILAFWAMIIMLALGTALFVFG